jgi:hypothetical protein
MTWIKRVSANASQPSRNRQLISIKARGLVPRLHLKRQNAEKSSTKEE